MDFRFLDVGRWMMNERTNNRLYYFRMRMICISVLILRLCSKALFVCPLSNHYFPTVKILAALSDLGSYLASILCTLLYYYSLFNCRLLLLISAHWFFLLPSSFCRLSTPYFIEPWKWETKNKRGFQFISFHDLYAYLYIIYVNDVTSSVKVV